MSMILKTVCFWAIRLRALITTASRDSVWKQSLYLQFGAATSAQIRNFTFKYLVSEAMMLINILSKNKMIYLSIHLSRYYVYLYEEVMHNTTQNIVKVVHSTCALFQALQAFNIFLWETVSLILENFSLIIFPSAAVLNSWFLVTRLFSLGCFVL